VCVHIGTLHVLVLPIASDGLAGAYCSCSGKWCRLDMLECMVGMACVVCSQLRFQAFLPSLAVQKCVLSSHRSGIGVTGG